MRIEDFFLFHHGNFNGASITPKLHIIKEHMVDFLRQWIDGYGFLGKQGAESIHITFNEFTSTIRNSVDSLHQMTMEHHRRTSPMLNHYRALLQAPKTLTKMEG